MKRPDMYKVRLASPNDAEDMTWIHVQSWKTNYKGIISQKYLDSINYEELLINRKEVLEKGIGFHLVSIYQEKVVGFCEAGFSILRETRKSSIENRIEKGEVYSIYVRDEHQGQGVGRELFKQALFWLKKKELSPVIVWTLKENQKARAFYESQGGKLIEVMEVCIGEELYSSVGYHFL